MSPVDTSIQSSPTWVQNLVKELAWVGGYVSSKYPDIYAEAVAARTEAEDEA